MSLGNRSESVIPVEESDLPTGSPTLAPTDPIIHNAQGFLSLLLPPHPLEPPSSPGSSPTSLPSLTHLPSSGSHSQPGWEQDLLSEVSTSSSQPSGQVSEIDSTAKKRPYHGSESSSSLDQPLGQGSNGHSPLDEQLRQVPKESLPLHDQLGQGSRGHLSLDAQLSLTSRELSPLDEQLYQGSNESLSLDKQLGQGSSGSLHLDEKTKQGSNGQSSQDEQLNQGSNESLPLDEKLGQRSRGHLSLDRKNPLWLTPFWVIEDFQAPRPLPPGTPLSSDRMAQPVEATLFPSTQQSHSLDPGNMGVLRGLHILQPLPQAQVRDSEMMDVPQQDLEFWGTFYFAGAHRARELLLERSVAGHS